MDPTIDEKADEGETIDEKDIELEELNLTPEFKSLILSLPRERGWRTRFLYLYQNFWCQIAELQAIHTLQSHFQARDSDVIVATIPKSGTTWLKALTFAIVNRKLFSPFSENHPLLSSNPHHLVPFFEYNLYTKYSPPDLSAFSDPRLFGTHIPFDAMPSSIKNSNCKILYICRNPFDTFVSSWSFTNKIKPESMPPLEIEYAFDKFCNGVVGFGPFWDHMLGYWRESKERPQKVLFLKYEDMKKDPNSHLKMIAEFLGCPFSLEEETSGVVDCIVKLCSFEKMKELEVNKSSVFAKNFESKHLFRKAEIGDWVNHFSPSMVERLSKLVDEKLGGSGLSFTMLS